MTTKSTSTSRKPLMLAISGALTLGFAAQVIGQFPAEFQLSDLNGMNGFKLDGEGLSIHGENSGFSVSAAGDVNGDGLYDLIIGAPSTNFHSGRSYVVFGKTVGFSSPLQLSALTGSNGFKLDGEAANDYSGISVSAAGDINGDGVDDLIVGAPRADANGFGSGRSYVVFGKSEGSFFGTIQLSDLNGTNGFKLNGEMTDDYSGHSVSAAGDVNGDGIDDLIVGAHFADPNGGFSGRSYMVFGQTGAFASPLQLSTLDGTTGFTLDGEMDDDRSGFSVSAAGDVNADGIDDIIIGAPNADISGLNSADGRSYVVFGRSDGFPQHMQLSDLNGANGFKLNGEFRDDRSGFSVNTAGDINGDGIDDLIIGGPYASPNGLLSGRIYVVFGRRGVLPPQIQLSDLDGNNGFKIDGERVRGYSGLSVSGAGDINGDGIDDLIIGGVPSTALYGGTAGRSYVVFGHTGTFLFSLQLSDLNGINGFKLDGEVAGDYSGRSVSAAGDINGDGVDDLIIGADGANPNGEQSGRSYVVFGQLGETVFRNGFED